MYHYTISLSDQDGIHWVVEIEHGKKFSKKEFDSIAEEALVYALTKDKQRSFIETMETSYIVEFLKSHGFKQHKITRNYEFRPFDDCLNNLKSKKLLNLVLFL